MKIRLAFRAGLLAVYLCASVHAQSYTPFPGVSQDERTLRMQERVEELYVSGDFERALLIYQKDLAPLGDKYAQYMVGYMHLNAQSVPQDRVSALAWYRIAAERGETVLEKARDELLADMTAQEIAESDRHFVDLWNSISDTRIIMKLIRNDMDTLRNRTGTRITGAAASSPAMIYRPSGQPMTPNYYRDVRVRLEARLTYLETKIEIKDIAIESESVQLSRLQQQVREELAALELP